MYPKNSATPPEISVGALVQISDGSIQTTGASVTVKKQGGSETAGGGTLACEATSGIWTYIPTQAETNTTSFIVSVYKSGSVPISITVVTTATATPGTVVVTTNNDKTGYTASTVSDKTGYSLTQAFPANFSALAIGLDGVTLSILIGDQANYLSVLALDFEADLPAGGTALQSGVIVDSINPGAITAAAYANDSIFGQMVLTGDTLPLEIPLDAWRYGFRIVGSSDAYNGRYTFTPESDPPVLLPIGSALEGDYYGRDDDGIGNNARMFFNNAGDWQLKNNDTDVYVPDNPTQLCGRWHDAGNELAPTAYMWVVPCGPMEAIAKSLTGVAVPDQNSVVGPGQASGIAKQAVAGAVPVVTNPAAAVPNDASTGIIASSPTQTPTFLSQQFTLPACIGGTFTITIAGQTTAAIVYTADAPTVQAAINAVTGLSNVIVTGTNPGPFTLDLSSLYQPTLAVVPMTIDTSQLQVSATGNSISLVSSHAIKVTFPNGPFNGGTTHVQVLINTHPTTIATLTGASMKTLANALAYLPTAFSGTWSVSGNFTSGFVLTSISPVLTFTSPSLYSTSLTTSAGAATIDAGTASYLPGVMLGAAQPYYQVATASQVGTPAQVGEAATAVATITQPIQGIAQATTGSTNPDPSTVAAPGDSTGLARTQDASGGGSSVIAKGSVASSPTSTTSAFSPDDSTIGVIPQMGLVLVNGQQVMYMLVGGAFSLRWATGQTPFAPSGAWSVAPIVYAANPTVLAAPIIVNPSTTWKIKS